MSEPIWIGLHVAQQVHVEQLVVHGGIRGVREPGLLESALARPRQTWNYSEPKPDMFALAASLAFGVCKNHPFLDGNKRTAWVLCRTLLRLNECDVEVSQSEIIDAVLALAAGETTEAGFAAWLRDHAQTFDR